MMNQSEAQFAQNYTVFHRYWISSESLIPQKRMTTNQAKYTLENRRLASTVCKCRLISQNPLEDYQNYFAMKIVSYLKQTPSKKKNQNRLLDLYTKHIEQIETQYSALQLLSKCHRVTKLKEIIHENVKRQDDKNFFYNFLKKPKFSGQRYICIVTEFCNQGDLDKIIKSKNGMLTEEQVLNYAFQIIEGIYELKKRKIIHRDLRLCNILVHNNQIKFSDFDTCFIGGKSTWKDVKNGIDIETSPPQVIELASKPDDELQMLDSQELYQRQQKSDIYYFGLALFNMIYGYNFDKFNKETLSNMISEKLATSKYNENMLNIVVQCLEQNAQKRIDFDTLYKSFVEIEKVKYFEERSIDKLYLSQEPICFAISKTTHNDDNNFKVNTIQKNNFTSGSNYIDFKDYIKISEHHRISNLYTDTFLKRCCDNFEEIWRRIQIQKKQSKKFIQIMEAFIRTISIRTFYYECLYKTILCINSKNLRIKQNIRFVKNSKNNLQKQLTVVLSFLFKLLFKTPFTRDKRYCAHDLPYQTMKLLRNIVKSDVIQNKMHCYFGKSRQINFENSKISKRITIFYNKCYHAQNEFQPIYNNILKLMEQIDKKIKKLLMATIINLRIAYDNLHLKQIDNSNVKEVLFILISLQQIDLNKLKKSQIIVIWNNFLPLLNEQVQLDVKQVEIILSQYKKIYYEQQLSVTHQRASSVIDIDIEKNIGQLQQEVGKEIPNIIINSINEIDQSFQKEKQMYKITQNMCIKLPNNENQGNKQAKQLQILQISSVNEQSNYNSLQDKIQDHSDILNINKL